MDGWGFYWGWGRPHGHLYSCHCISSWHLFWYWPSFITRSCVEGWRRMNIWRQMLVKLIIEDIAETCGRCWWHAHQRCIGHLTIPYLVWCHLNKHRRRRTQMRRVSLINEWMLTWARIQKTVIQKKSHPKRLMKTFMKSNEYTLVRSILNSWKKMMCYQFWRTQGLELSIWRVHWWVTSLNKTRRRLQTLIQPRR